MNAGQASRIRKGVNFGLRYVQNLQSTDPKLAIRTFNYAHTVIGKDKLSWRAYERVVERGCKRWINSAPSDAETLQRVDIMIDILDEEIALIRGNIK